MAQHRASLTTTLRRHDVMLLLIVSLLIAVSQLGAVSHAQTTRESISRLHSTCTRIQPGVLVTGSSCCCCDRRQRTADRL